MNSWRYMRNVFCLTFFIISQSSADKNIFCYYSNREWNKDMKFTIQKIDPFLCTHLVYYNVGMDRTASIVKKMFQTKEDFVEINKLKALNKNLKTMIDVGGSQYLAEFYTVLTSEDLRKTWAKNIVDFAIMYQFDGVYMHWYHKNLLKSAFSKDMKDSFSLLLKEFRKATSEKSLLLASQIVTSDNEILFFDIPQVVKLVDFLCLYTESINLSTETKKKTTAGFILARVQKTIYNAISSGIPAEKLVFQINHFRAEEFKLILPTINYFDAPASGSRIFHTYTKICGREIKGYTNKWDESEYTMYAFKGNQWITYENKKSMSIKVNFMKAMNLAGVMVDLHEDDFDDVCKEGKYPMIRHIIQDINTSNDTSRFIYIHNKNKKTKLSIDKNVKKMGSNNACKSIGYVNDPNDCDTFHYCMKDEDETFKTHKLNCHNGLLFDEKLLVCNYLYIFGKHD